MAINVLPVVSSAVANGSQTFNASSTWTAPAGVTAVNYIIAAGGGGGGAACNSTTNSSYNFATGGGAGGEVARGTISVTPGTTYPITVGAGGAGGTATTSIITTAAAVGGYSAIAPSFVLENAIPNGAMELSNNDGWMGGFSGTAGFPLYNNAYPADYNGQPSINNNLSYNNQRSTGTNIPGVSDGSNLKRYSYQSSNQAYNDIQKFINVTENTDYVLSGWTSVINGGVGSQVAIAIDYYTSANAVGRISGNQTSFTTVSTSSNVWTRISLNTTSPAGANFAVVRFANNNNYSSAQMGWTGCQLEGGSTLTDYVGMNTSGTKTISGLGTITLNSGVIVAGGGGGASNQTNAAVPGAGFGGGSAYTGSQNQNYHVGGNGSGQGGKLNNIQLFPSSSTMPWFSAFGQTNNGNGNIPSGGNSYAANAGSAGYLIQQDGAPATSEGLGAGGMAPRGNLVIPGTPGIGAGLGITGGQAGNSANANSGAGGGGAMASTAAATSAFAGGNGGSGKVILSW